MKKFKILIFLLIATNLFTVLFFVQDRNNQIENYANNFENPYPFLDLTRNFISKKNFIVNLQPLRDSLSEIYKQYGEENISLYIEFLNSGANISYNQDARYYPASLIKMPVAIAAAKKVQDGEWKWDDQMVIFDDDVDTKFGEIGKKPIGTRLTIEELMRALLTVSDNTAYKILLRNVGVGPVNDFLTETGLNDFFDQDLNITAKEYTRLFRSLYTASYLSKEYSQQVLKWLSESEKNYLGLGLPENVTYSHKFGENVVEFIYADSGIVYIPERAYIITALYKGTGVEDQSYINELFKKLGSTVYEYFNNYQSITDV